MVAIAPWSAARDLEEGTEVLAADAKADDARHCIDRVDHLGGHEPAPLVQQASGAHGQSVGAVGVGAVHDALDAAERASRRIGDEVAARAGEVDRDAAHGCSFVAAAETPAAACRTVSPDQLGLADIRNATTSTAVTMAGAIDAAPRSMLADGGLPFSVAASPRRRKPFSTSAPTSTAM